MKAFFHYSLNRRVSLTVGLRTAAESYKASKIRMADVRFSSGHQESINGFLVGNETLARDCFGFVIFDAALLVVFVNACGKAATSVTASRHWVSRCRRRYRRCARAPLAEVCAAARSRRPSGMERFARRPRCGAFQGLAGRVRRPRRPEYPGCP